MKQDEPFLKGLDQRLLQKYPPLNEFLYSLGDSPLIEVPAPHGGARIFAKCEWTNPAGTVKDRAVFGMLYEVLIRSSHDGIHLLEYTGGSLGLSLSALCARLKIRLTLTLSESTAPALLDELRQHGTQVILTPKNEGFWGVMQRAHTLAAENPSWTFLYQHTNPANVWMHRETTGPEIIRQLPKGAADGPCAWIASIGTGATLEGVRQYASTRILDMKTYATSPAELPYGSLVAPNDLPKFLGSGGLGLGRKQPFIEPVEQKIAAHVHLSYHECLVGMIEMHSLTGLKIGSSAAANWIASRTIASALDPSGTVITIFPSAATCAEWQRAITTFSSKNHLH